MLPGKYHTMPVKIPKRPLEMANPQDEFNMHAKLSPPPVLPARFLRKVSYVDVGQPGPRLPMKKPYFPNGRPRQQRKRPAK